MTTQDTNLDAATETRAAPPLVPLVVVAEDDDDVREALVAALQDDGLRVRAVPDGEMLAELLGECERLQDLPAVIITDHRMPGYTGLELLEGIQQIGMPVPVIVMTAFGAEVGALARAAGALAVFQKPFDLDDVRTGVFWAVNWQAGGDGRVWRPRRAPPIASADSSGRTDEDEKVGLRGFANLAKTLGLWLISLVAAAETAGEGLRQVAGL